MVSLHFRTVLVPRALCVEGQWRRDVPSMPVRNWATGVYILVNAALYFGGRAVVGGVECGDSVLGDDVHWRLAVLHFRSRSQSAAQ